MILLDMENQKTGHGFEPAVLTSNYLILIIIIFLTERLLTTNNFRISYSCH